MRTVAMGRGTELPADAETASKMISASRLRAAALMFVVVTPIRLPAQGNAPARPGEQVRLEVAGPSTAPVGFQCTGQVKEVALDTLVVASAGDCPAGSYFADVQVVRGDRGSRLTHVVLAGLAGGVAGALVARASDGNCGPAGCIGDDAGYVSGIQTMVYTATGALVGAFAGLVLPAGPRWVRAGVARPLRVVGLDVRPSLRVSIATRRQR